MKIISAYVGAAGHDLAVRNSVDEYSGAAEQLAQGATEYPVEPLPTVRDSVAD